MGNGNLHQTVDVLLHLQDGLLIHLLAVAVEQLDAVVVEGVVGGGDHNTAVKVIHPGDVGHGGGGGDMHDVGICAAGHQAGTQGVLKHIGGSSGILADDHLCLFIQSRAVVPAQKTADFHSVLKSQIFVGLSPEAVGSKILAHMHYSFSALQTIVPLFFQMLLAGTTPRTQEVG